MFVESEGSNLYIHMLANISIVRENVYQHGKMKCGLLYSLIEIRIYFIKLFEIQTRIMQK